MKKNRKFFKTLCLIICLFFHGTRLIASSGFEKCERLFSILEKNGSSPENQSLVFNESNAFPFNIIDTFPVNAEKKIEPSKKNDAELSELFLVFRVEDFHDKEKIITEISKKIKNIKRKVKVSVVFTYGDEVFSWKGKITGAERFSSAVSDAASKTAICIRLSSRNSIIPGGNTGASPTYLVKLAANSFASVKEDYSIEAGLITFLYEEGFLKTDERADIFFQAGLPSIAVNISSKPETVKKIPEFVECIVKNIPNEKSVNPDRRANLIKIGKKFFSTSEKLTTTLFLAFSFLSLFVLCEFSFVSKKTGEKLTEDVKKLWYVLPLTVAATVLSLFMAQLLTLAVSAIIGINVYIQVVIKIVIAFSISSVTFFATLKTRRFIELKAYSYILTICAIINLVFFISLDISLFYLFALEYALIYVTRPEKHTLTMSSTFLVLVLPFVPYAIHLIKFSKTDGIMLLVKSGIGINLIISFLIVPFEIMWLRILVRLNQKWQDSNKSTRHFYIQNALWISAAFAIFLALTFTSNLMIPKKYKIQKEKKETLTIEKNGNDFIEIDVKDKTYFGETTRLITIRTKEECRNVEVALSSDSGNPVMYSDNDYISDKTESKDYFRLPVNPPKEISFRYIANRNAESRIKVTAIKEAAGDNGKSSLVMYEHEISIPRRQK